MGTFEGILNVVGKVIDVSGSTLYAGQNLTKHIILGRSGRTSHVLNFGSVRIQMSDGL